MAKKKNRFIKVLEETKGFDSNEIWADTQTGVQYLVVAAGFGGGVTVLVDSEGKPLLYRSAPEAPEYK